MNSPPNLKNNQIDERHVTSYANLTVHTHTHTWKKPLFTMLKSHPLASHEFYSFRLLFRDSMDRTKDLSLPALLTQGSIRKHGGWGLVDFWFVLVTSWIVNQDVLIDFGSRLGSSYFPFFVSLLVCGTDSSLRQLLKTFYGLKYSFEFGALVYRLFLSNHFRYIIIDR